MSLSAKYQAFLATPSADALAENASLHYITTLTSIHDAAAIVKHLTTQEKLLKKKDQKVLSAVEGANGLSVDVETTIDFVSSGGAYLPGLDDNFVADRTVTFPMVHMVHFDSSQKIVQIRLYWDQGSLLKQIDVIGARARNWPIRDGREQSRLIASSFATVAKPESAPSSRPSTASRGPDEVSVTEHPISSRRSTNNAMNDPHATLSLFQPRDANRDAAVSQPIAPRAQSAKPPPREYSELFVGEDPASPSPANAYSSPQKRGIPAKSGAGKNFKPNRLFEGDEEEIATPAGPPSPQKRGIPAKSGAGKNFKPNRLFEETEEEKAAPTPMSVKTNAKKYDHFEFGNGEDEATPKVRETARPKSKHMSQWDFEDFVTPEKVREKVLGQSVRHFGWSDDEDEGSPVRRPVVHKARPDAEAHFEFVDDGTPEGQRKEAVSKGRLHNKGLGLYKDHVLGSTSDDEDDTPKGDAKRPLNDVTTHIKNENRQKDFGAHWEMRDDSPGPEKAPFNGNKLPENKKKVLKTMDANWGLYADSPEQPGIKTAGNGMGGRKGTDASWTLYGESPTQAKKENVGIKTTSNGTDARKNTDSFWDF